MSIALPPPAGGAGAEPRREREITFRRAGTVVAPVIRRVSLRPGEALSGPAVIEEADATCLVDLGDRVSVLPHGSLAIDVAREE
jgi:N-methylhydantoinase A/oxoprolinase/acetone carboxylase beta subunit